MGKSLNPSQRKTQSNARTRYMVIAVRPYTNNPYFLHIYIYDLYVLKVTGLVRTVNEWEYDILNVR